MDNRVVMEARGWILGPEVVGTSSVGQCGAGAGYSCAVLLGAIWGPAVWLLEHKLWPPAPPPTSCVKPGQQQGFWLHFVAWCEPGLGLNRL